MPPNESLISAAALVEQIGQPGLCVVDCRFRLTEPEAGRALYRQGHIPRARYADLDRDLADTGQPGGRHPLPEVGAFARTLASWGWQPGDRLVAYDDAHGAIAARLWWMMRHLGQRAAILDGGLPAWLAVGGSLEQGEVEVRPAAVADLSFGHMPVVAAEEVESGLREGSILLIDARAAARFRGEVEPIDGRAGHVPGARNRPFQVNLDADGRIRCDGALESDWRALIGEEQRRVVHMCGSGVTACLNLLVAEQAGLGVGSLFVGSWSGWIESDQRAVAHGAET